MHKTLKAFKVNLTDCKLKSWIVLVTH